MLLSLCELHSVIKCFCHCVNFTAASGRHRRCSPQPTEAVWSRPLLLGCKPAQRVAVLTTVGSCNTMGSVCVSTQRKVEYKHSIKDLKGCPVQGTCLQRGLQDWRSGFTVSADAQHWMGGRAQDPDHPRTEVASEGSKASPF